MGFPAWAEHLRSEPQNDARRLAPRFPAGLGRRRKGRPERTRCDHRHLRDPPDKPGL